MKPISELKVAARIESLPALVQSVTESARDYGFDSKLSAIELVLEEAFVNICNYSYPEGEGVAEIKCSLRDGRFIIEMADYGVPFDITSLPDPDTSKDISGRSVGGLGIFFIRKMTDYVRYERKANKNVLSLAVGLSER